MHLWGHWYHRFVLVIFVLAWENASFYGLLTLPDPESYIVLCRNAHTSRSQIHIPILTANYRNGICGNVINPLFYLCGLQGGIRGVVWADVFQTVVLLAGLLAVVVQVRITSGRDHQDPLLNRVFPKWSRIFIEFRDFSKFRESYKSMKHELVSV